MNSKELERKEIEERFKEFKNTKESLLDYLDIELNSNTLCRNCEWNNRCDHKEPSCECFLPIEDCD